MSSFLKPEVICTHESDLDGLVAGVLLRRLARALHGVEVPLQAWNYQGWKNRQMSERSAWVTDFTFETRLDRPEWVVIDHHSTAVQAQKARLIHDSHKSASLLCYELCCQQGLQTPAFDRLVELTNIGDLWLRDRADFELACDYANLVKTYGFWQLHDLLGGELERLLEHPLLEVMAVKRRVEDPLGFEWSRVHVEAVTEEVGVVRTTIGNTNLIVHQLLDRGATPFKVLATLFPKANRTIVVSFRSQHGEALGVAAKLQGGGHPNAAGTTLPKSVQDQESALIYLRQTLAPATLSGGGLNHPFAGLKL
jgi:oligoribonuclease NrnB/cAMP/cGMP phosphodiesterase (DHH superfamily)